jgi:hypothetical protein
MSDGEKSTDVNDPFSSLSASFPNPEKRGIRVARFFSVQIYQNGKSIPNVLKLYQTAIFYTKCS